MLPTSPVTVKRFYQHLAAKDEPARARRSIRLCLEYVQAPPGEAAESATPVTVRWVAPVAQKTKSLAPLRRRRA